MNLSTRDYLYYLVTGNRLQWYYLGAYLVAFEKQLCRLVDTNSSSSAQPFEISQRIFSGVLESVFVDLLHVYVYVENVHITKIAGEAV